MPHERPSLGTVRYIRRIAVSCPHCSHTEEVADHGPTYDIAHIPQIGEARDCASCAKRFLIGYEEAA